MRTRKLSLPAALLALLVAASVSTTTQAKPLSCSNKGKQVKVNKRWAIKKVASKDGAGSSTFRYFACRRSKKGRAVALASGSNYDLDNCCGGHTGSESVAHLRLEENTVTLLKRSSGYSSDDGGESCSRSDLLLKVDLAKHKKATLYEYRFEAAPDSGADLRCGAGVSALVYVGSSTALVTQENSYSSSNTVVEGPPKLLTIGSQGQKKEIYSGADLLPQLFKVDGKDTLIYLTEDSGAVTPHVYTL